MKLKTLVVVIKPDLVKSVKLATPATAEIVFVPLSVPLDIATVTEAVESSTLFPSASWISMTGWVVKATRFTKPAAFVVWFSLVAAP